jgi:predicted AlkP superfamily pyrophosphatase or phosphodiesterase
LNPRSASRALLRVVFVALVVMALPPRATFAQKAVTPTKAPSAKLAVVVSVDGLSWDRMWYYRPWYVAGLKRLLDESRTFTEARYRHLNTETGPGHSSLSTGAPPRVTGVVANRWFEMAPDGSILSLNCVDRPAPPGPPGTPPMFYRVIEKEGRLYVFAQAAALERWEASGEAGQGIVRLGYGPKGETVVFDSDDAIVLFNLENGRPHETFASTRMAPGPGALRVPTLGDRLVEVKPGARVVALSAKDRSTIFMAGRHERHSAYWYDQDSGRFVTSPFYFPPAGAKSVVDVFNRRRAGPHLAGRFGLAWKALPSPEPPSLLPLERPAPAAGLLDYQLPTNGLGWDHPLTVHDRGYFTALYYSPFVDELVADLALSFLADESFALGRRGTPDLLWLSFSAQDTVSHSYGVESEENLDVLRRLDLQLARVLDALERLYPKGSVVLALSADHGMPVIPEAERQRNPSFRGGRLLTTDRGYPTFVERLNRLLAVELCLDPASRPIFGTDGYLMMYNRPAFPFRTIEGPCGPAGAAVNSKDLDRVLPRVMTRFYAEEVEKVYLVSERERWPKDDPVTEFVENDFDPARSGDAFFVPRHGVMTHWDPARGVMHGSHYDYDTHVPLLFWGGPFKAETVSAAATPYDLAPTVGAVLGVELKDATGTSRLH